MIEEPISVGKLVLKNRLVMPPMQTDLPAGGRVTDALVAYYRDRAEQSRPGLVITEHSCISEAGRAAPKQLSIGEDDMIGDHRRLTEAIHEGGSAVFVQLNFAGGMGTGDTVSASAVNVPVRKLSRRPRPLTTEEIHLLEEQFAAAAVRAVDAGYDGVEIHSAHAYLLDQFYSPMTNRRTDEYGGTLKNRTRFLMETIEKVRAAIGADVPLAVRLGGADYLPGGATEEDAVETSKLLEAAGVDLLDISGGMCGFMRPGHREPGYFSSMTEKICRVVSIPVILTGGIRKLADAERLLSEGKADLIGVGRALFKDAGWRSRA